MQTSREMLGTVRAWVWWRFALEHTSDVYITELPCASLPGPVPRPAPGPVLQCVRGRVFCVTLSLSGTPPLSIVHLHLFSVAQEGFGSFYRGFGATLIGAGPRGAVGFGVFETLKREVKGAHL